MAPSALSLDTITMDVLEHIAFFLGTVTFLGPPSAIVALLSTNRRIHSCLSTASNHHLYARIFAYKFDCASASRRLNPECTTAAALSGELQRRFFYLGRVRERLDSVVKPSQVRSGGEALQQVLWVAYLMMLENDGKNEQQLRDYARMDLWLNEYFFHDHGASYAKSSIGVNRWPEHNEQTALAMWTFWFLLKPDNYRNDHVLLLNITNTLKLFALAAHQYPLCVPSWIDFIPNSRTSRTEPLVHYTKTIHLVPPSLGAPAILSFLTLVNSLPASGQLVTYNPLLTPPRSLEMTSSSRELECEWARCVNLGRTDYDRVLSGAFRPGSLEGVWEGVMTYSEFTAYAALLSGAPPPVLQKSLVPQHRQTWKLREYHFSISDLVYSPSGVLLENHPMSPGDPSKAHIPRGTDIREVSGRLEVREPGRNMLYRRGSVGSTRNIHDQSRVQDVIVIGEGHSAWGQFTMLGRVRPCDGLVSLCKDYVNGDRGMWLYRGYLIGDVNGSLAGRWRDTLSPANVPGYEGSFVLSRRC